MDKTKHRLLQYLGVSVALLLGFAWLRDSPWQGNTQLHTLMEVVATLLALNVGILALVRFYTRKNNMFLFLGSGFLGTGFLDLYHTVVTSTFFQDLFPSPPPSLIPWSWVASRLFLALLMYFSYLAWRREDRLGEAGAISERMVYLGITFLTLSSFVFFAFVPLPRAYYPEIPFHRPEEFVPALFFLLALIGYFRKGEWRISSFEHWVVLSLVVGVVSEAVFMSFSGILFDSMFDLAHLLKKVSYVFVLTGLLVNMYLLFYRVEENQRILQTVFDTIPHWVMLKDRESNYLMVNKAFAESYGKTPAEFRNLSPYNLGVPKEEVEVFLEADRKVIETGKRVEQPDLEITYPDGRKTIQRAIRLPLFDSSGGVSGVVVDVEDITESKKAEEELQESERRATEAHHRLVDAIESISDGFALYNSEDRLVLWNQKFFDLNTETQDLIRAGISFETLIRAAAERGQVLGVAGREEEWVQERLVHHRNPGGSFERQVSGGRWFLANEHRTREGGIVGTWTDITERMEVERMKSEFISTVSHELRTPLASIVGYADLLVDGDAGELKETQREFVEIMSKNALRLTDLVGDLLDIEKLEDGRVALSLEPLDLNEVLLITHMTFKVVAEEKGLQLQVNSPQGLMINGDKDRLVQVFSNLASNSIKYTRQGSVDISAVQAGDAIQVTVRDTGIGMDAQVVEKLFSKFFRAGDAYTRAAGGTGLGLAIAKAIVLQHGGTIEVTSQPGEGSVFTVSLPSMEIGQVQASDLAPSPMENPEAPMVLCVMVDTRVLQSLKPLLQEAGISCRTATNAEDCIRIARQEKPALITLDAVLQDQEGWEVIKKLKNDPETTEIPIVLTSLIEEKEALRLGASAVVPKPVNPEELLGILLRLLKGSGRRVLIVDDDRDFADVLQRTLRKQGVESDICLSGADALQACKRKNYEAIVLDYKMPGMSGLEVLKSLKLESRKDLHVIFISGSTIDKSIEQEALTLGSEIFLNKKIGIAEIAQAIRARLKQVEEK